MEQKVGVCGGQLETDEGRRKRLGCLGVCVWRERHSLGLSVGVCVLERLGIVFVETGVLVCGGRDGCMFVEKVCE